MKFGKFLNPIKPIFLGLRITDYGNSRSDIGLSGCRLDSPEIMTIQGFEDY